MVVQHNLTAMNSNRMFNLTNKSQSKSTEKLSSGYKRLMMRQGYLYQKRCAARSVGLPRHHQMRRMVFPVCRRRKAH